MTLSTNVPGLDDHTAASGSGLRHGIMSTLWVLALLGAAAIAHMPLSADDARTPLPASDARNESNEPGSTTRLLRLTDDGLFKQRPVWSPDGNVLCFARHEGSTIFLYLRSSDGEEIRLTDRSDPEYDAQFSPDGTRIVFAVDNASPNQGDIDIYSCAADGTDRQPVAVTDGKLSHEESPCWSPDGEWVAFTSTRDGNQEVYIARFDGSEPQRLTDNGAIDAHPSWSPDGRQIAFATSRWGDLELAVIDRDGSNLMRLTESRGLDDYPAWSPDGSLIAFTSNREGNFEVYTIQPDGSAPRNVSQHTSIDNFPSWTPDGRLTFVSGRDSGFDVYVEGP